MAQSSQPWDGTAYPASTDDDMNSAMQQDGVVDGKLQ